MKSYELTPNQFRVADFLSWLKDGSLNLNPPFQRRSVWKPAAKSYLIAGATQERTLAVMQQVEGFILKQPEVQSMVGVLGFSFSGQGQNAGLAFVHAEGLGRARRRRALGRRRWPAAPSAR